jgi:hypothetical protein
MLQNLSIDFDCVHERDGHEFIITLSKHTTKPSHKRFHTSGIKTKKSIRNNLYAL